MVAKGPVSVNWQTVFVIIPILDLWAAYRIQKLRIYLLIFALGFGVASIVLELAITGTQQSTFEQGIISDPFGYYNPTSIVGFIILEIIAIGLAIYLIRKWSKDWNAKF